jgi:hypothetical protein
VEDVSAPRFRVVTREIVVDQHHHQRVVTQVGRDVALGESLVVGTQGNLPLGLTLPDKGISRTALEITPTAEHWQIAVGNSNGAVMCPWGLPRAMAKAGTRHQVAWPRVAMRVLGTNASHYYWVLMETDAYPLPERGQGTTATTVTWLNEPPPHLTPAMEAAVGGVFEEFLAWPPVPLPAASGQDKVGRRLGISQNAVQERLKPAVQRAQGLGLTTGAALTQVDWVHLRNVPPFVAGVSRF